MDSVSLKADNEIRLMIRSLVRVKIPITSGPFKA